MNRAWIAIALAALVIVAIASLAIPFASQPSSGLVLAIVKIVVLAFVFVRVLARDAYALQWSSMLILAYFAEGVVRAMSDGSATASYGTIAAAGSILYFAATLALLRPLKKAAREAKAPRRG